MAFDIEEEMQSELESSIDTRELLPRDSLFGCLSRQGQVT